MRAALLGRCGGLYLIGGSGGGRAVGLDVVGSPAVGHGGDAVVEVLFERSEGGAGRSKGRLDPFGDIAVAAVATDIDIIGSAGDECGSVVAVSTEFEVAVGIGGFIEDIGLQGEIGDGRSGDLDIHSGGGNVP